MISLRPAYVPIIAGRSGPAPDRRQVIVGVGIAAQNTQGPAADAVDPKDLGLYVGLPAVGVGLVAVLVGLSTPIALIAGVLGGGAGYLYLDSKLAADAAAADAASKRAATNAKAAADAKEAERKSKLDVVGVALQIDEIGVQAKAGLSLFSIGYVPGGAAIDWKLAAFSAVPTDKVVEQLTALQKSLTDAGYARAAGQIADAASSAAKLRDVGGTVLTTTDEVIGGTVEATP